MYPPRHYVRRGELVVWLEDVFGLKPWRVRCLIEEGVIPGHRLVIYKRQRVYVPREVYRVLVSRGELVR